MEELERFKELKENIDTLSAKKIRLDERYQNQRAQLDSLLKEIKNKGFDPQKLSETRKEKEEELRKLLSKLEEETKEVSTKLAEIEE